MAIKFVDGIGRELFIKGQDMICRNCKFNFPQDDGQNLCAAHESHWGYGEKIEDENESCHEFGISFEFYEQLLKEKYN